MLYSATVIEELIRFFRAHRSVPLIIDPVMVSTSGRGLLEGRALPALEKLLRLATLVTPNLDEASVLANCTVASEEQMRLAAKAIHAEFGCAVLVKGGHLKGSRTAADIFFDGSDEFLLTAPYVHGIKTHGTGCTYSAAITAFLARGFSLAASIKRAKQFVAQSIADGRLSV